MISLVKQIEAAVIAAMETVVGDAAKVTGFRASVAQGLVKSQESDGRPEVIVAVAPASSDNYASLVVNFDVAISVRLKWRDDPTIEKFDEIAALVERQLIRWNSRANIEVMSAALSTANFRCDGFRLGGGNDSVEADTRPYIANTQNFTVKGVFVDDDDTDDNTAS
jgi:hypothetical protein